MRSLLLVSALLLAACTGGSDPAPVDDGAVRAQAADAPPPFALRPDGATVIDVRTPPEWSGGTIAGAERVNLLQPDFVGRVEALGLDKSEPVYLYCRSGARSGRAEASLREAGYTRVVNAGAYGDLVSAGASVEE